MNHELFALRPDEAAKDARAYLQTLGIHAAPVLDDAGKPVGMLSVSDLLGELGSVPVSERMSSPVVGIGAAEDVDAAARLFAETGYHHLVVVDEGGKAVGFLSIVDSLRALVGHKTTHPPSFPHYDRSTGLVWTDDEELTEAGVEAAPDGPGIFVLIRGGAGEVDTIVWAEPSNNVRTSLLALVAGAPSPIRGHLAHGRLRFRAASAVDPDERARAFEALGDRIISGAPAPPV